MSVRKDLADRLEADWAEHPILSQLRVVATERKLDDPVRGTALIRQKRIATAAEAPRSHVDVSLLLTIIAPQQNPDAAADWLDDVVAAVLVYLAPRYRHEPAELTDWTSARLAYDIPLTILGPITPPA